jgi:non-ribosomal peptide synthetase-like protein
MAGGIVFLKLGIGTTAGRGKTQVVDTPATTLRTPHIAVYSGGPAARSRTLWEIFEATAAQHSAAAALDDGTTVLTYAQLSDAAERLGSELTRWGVGPGDRVGVRVPSGTAQLYVSILAVLGVGAAYVPVDLDDPQERVDLVWAESGVCAVLGADGEVTRGTARPVGRRPRRPMPQDDAWVIFTSGTTGKPKGVAVTHRSAAAFVDAEAQLFVQDAPLAPGDRVLAGLSVAFDASCEEMWLAWRHGGCLVPAPRSLMRTGPELVDWLARRGITVVSTVPTMASLWPADLLSGIRLLVLGGEACPVGLADRLTTRCTEARSPEVWNTYGPTEGTVVSSAARLSAGQPVRIGLPLAGWQLTVLDPATGRPVPWGSIGELVIGGVGVARYLDAEQDARKFGPVEALGSGRAYRSGDLVRAEPEGLVYVGRADSQVKIRGYRIELSEIESVLLQVPGIAQAAVITHQQRAGVTELAAYYSTGNQNGSDPGDGVAAVDRQSVAERLRRRLPAHMVPAFLEELPVIPLLPSGKADHKKLPAPSSEGRLVVDRPYQAPRTPLETLLAESMADVLALDRISTDSHFFEDLGLSSLLVAHFCAKVRERADATCSPPSTRDVYLHPTVRQLADVVASPSTVSATVPIPITTGSTEPTIASGRKPQAAEPRHPRRLGAVAMVLCGVAQFAVFLSSLGVASTVTVVSLSWVSAARSWTTLGLRSLGLGSGLLILSCILPIAVKWVLIGRWTPRRIRVWSPTYLRFWLVRTILHASPLALMSGSPLYVLYLRALGAKIGRRVVILSGTLPVCTDLLTIGDDTVIRHGAAFYGYRARDGVVETGPVTIGAGAFIGERAVLDVGTVVGDGAQLGNSSSLHEGQGVPSGARWHGSPAQPTDVDYRRVDTLRPSPLRPFVHAAGQVLTLVLVTSLVLGVGGTVITQPDVTRLFAGGSRVLSGTTFYRAGLIVSALLFFGSLVAGAVVVLTVPRLLQRLITPGRVYPLYGVHHFVHRTIRRLTNVPFYLELFGDSSYVIGYLRALGYRMRDVEQTGSNFGASLDHDNPFLVEIGRGTMVADGASLLNADYSATSFRLSTLSIGAQNFLGNFVTFPAGGRTGDNCLIATKAMVPLEGPVRQDVGLLGSPCFEIPRSVTYDSRFDHLKTGDELRRRLGAKNRHNIVTMALFLVLRWLHVLGSTLIAMAVATEYRWTAGPAAVLGVSATLLAVLVFSFAYFVLVEWTVCGFRRLTPRYCSIYDPYFWWHERFWKLQTPYLAIFNGTPLKGLVWRLVGVKVGKRLFDDGCSIHERSLVTIGDDCTLNPGALIQCHSMEDGTFKSDHTVLGDGCTIGVGALVHYGVRIGDTVTLAPDSFLMKGETVPDRARWGGNPARPM